MNHAPARSRLLFNPLFRAVWIGIIASNLASAMAQPLPLAAVKMSTSLPMCLLALLSVVVSLYVHRHGHRQFAFKKMGSGTFAVSILTFLGFVGPWVMLCTAVILGLCAAIAMLSLQPVLLEIFSKIALPGTVGMHLARTAGNLASGVVATLMGPAAIFILSAVSLCAIFIAGKKDRLRGYGTALSSAR
ncbi:MFS transporter [Massilia sp. S19_KUP03_FR1]|uniref:MFS transporter n=1 Tax=Massilia sp. S19_KUP03_FR1 TaxID=3025503 RepID=UPI002FCD8060